KEKIYLLVRKFIEIAEENPELIDYFLRVFLSNREVFQVDVKAFYVFRKL
ncbi:hypothetical protein HG1285_10547, partial [Hydrogenivirga sp. 128-5-R1-1]